MMCPKITPRNYQQWAMDAVRAELQKDAPQNMLVLLPTGTGKSILPALTINYLLSSVWAGLRICVLTHSKELVQQNFDKLRQVVLNANAGIVSSGLGRKDIRCPIVFAGIQTARNALKNTPAFNVIIVDEAHRISCTLNAEYQQFFADQRARNPKLVIIGMTATNWINGKGPLQEVTNAVFSKVVFDACTVDAFNWFVDEGYLCDLFTFSMDTKFDLTGVTMSGDDYNEKKLQNAVDKDPITREALTEALAKAGERKRWLIFCAGIQHTLHTAAILNELGVSTTYVHSDKKTMSEKERDANIRDFKKGRYTAICNNGILTTGFDCPEVDLLVILRPTRSPILWVQILGRGTRPCYAQGYDLATKEGRLAAIAASDKPHCLVLDFANNIDTCGPINDPLYKMKGKGGGIAPIRTCEQCGHKQHTSIRRCKKCDNPFLEPELRIAAVANEKDIRKKKADKEPKILNLPVNFVTYSPHAKEGRPLGIKVTYFCGNKKFNEWLNFEPGAKLLGLSKKRWRQITDELPPVSTKKALEILPKLRAPKELCVYLNHPSGYATIQDYIYA